MTERLLKHQRDIIPLEPLEKLVQGFCRLIAFFGLTDSERAVLIVLDEQWASLREIETRAENTGLTAEEILAIIDRLIAAELVEHRHDRERIFVPDHSYGIGFTVRTQYRAIT